MENAAIHHNRAVREGHGFNGGFPVAVFNLYEKSFHFVISFRLMHNERNHQRNESKERDNAIANCSDDVAYHSRRDRNVT
jgi:hypothetical protein